MLYAAKALDGLTPENNDQKVGIDIVDARCRRRSVKSRKTPAPKVRSSSASCSTANDPNRGFDAQSGEYVDMVKAGIIDPTKVVRLALQNAASVAGLLVTTEAMVAEKPEKKAAPGMPHDHGMDGMDDY